MRIVVVGAGVVGVTTAYYLSELGCQVTVVDRETGVADGASFANAGQLSYSFTDALAKPEFVSKIPGIIAGRDRGYRVRLAPGLVPWGMRFLSQCTSRQASANTVSVLKTALRSEKLMRELQNRLPIKFSHRPAGKLVLLSTPGELSSAEANAAIKKEHSCKTEILGRDAAIEVEPALANIDEEFLAAVYSKSDSVADSHLFTVGLKNMLEKSGRVQFRLGSQVTRLNKDGQRLRSVELDDGELVADAFVVCAGAWSGELLRSLGINPQIYPVRGYSVTLPAGEDAPDVSLTFLGKKIVFSRINGDIRIAGFADFKGFRTSDDSRRIATLLEIARDVAPRFADYDSNEQAPWGGFRPMTPDGQPRVGATGVEGLYLNTGHGMLGWTLACASGHDVAKLVARTIH
jgi:D-amino-acid dehydrogenase